MTSPGDSPVAGPASTGTGRPSFPWRSERGSPARFFDHSYWWKDHRAEPDYGCRVVCHNKERTPNGERRSHPADPYTSHSRDEFLAFVTENFGPPMDPHKVTERLWRQSHVSISAVVPMPLHKLEDLPSPKILCTANRHFAQCLKRELRQEGWGVSCGTPGDSLMGMGREIDWPHRWKARTIGVASTMSEMSSPPSREISLIFVQGSANSGSNVEFCSRHDLARRISLEVFGRIRVVHTSVIAPRDILQFFGHRVDHLMKEWNDSYYARPDPRN